MADWMLLEVGGEVAGTGGILYHYNRPYGDIWMEVGEGFRGRGFGTYLVQELKRICREDGNVPCARCNYRQRGIAQDAAEGGICALRAFTSRKIVKFCDDQGWCEPGTHGMPEGEA